MDKDLEKLLNSVQGLTPEQRKLAEDAFSIEGLGKAVKDGTLRQDEFSRKQNELAEHRKQLDANWQKANEEFIEMQSSLETTAAEKLAAEEKLKQAEKDLEEAKKTTVDPTKVITPEQLTAELQRMQAGQTAYFGDVLEIVDQHQQLFGERLNPKALMQECIQAKKPPLEFWNEKYKVETKRAEVAKAAEDKRIKDAEDRGYKNRIAEEANPATRTPKSSNSPFYDKDAAENKQPWDEQVASPSEQKLVEELTATRG